MTGRSEEKRIMKEEDSLKSQLLIRWTRSSFFFISSLFFIILFMNNIQSSSSSIPLSPPSAASALSSKLLSASSSSPAAAEHFNIQMAALSLFPPSSASSLSLHPSSHLLSPSSAMAPTQSAKTGATSPSSQPSSSGRSRIRDEKRSISSNEEEEEEAEYMRRAGASNDEANDGDDENYVAKNKAEDELDYNPDKILSAAAKRRMILSTVTFGVPSWYGYPPTRMVGPSDPWYSHGDGTNDGPDGDDQSQRMRRSIEMVKKRSQLVPDRKKFLIPSSLSHSRAFHGRGLFMTGMVPRLAQQPGFKSEGRKRALSFFAHWRPADHPPSPASQHLQRHHQVFGPSDNLDTSGGPIALPISSSEINFVPPISSRGSSSTSSVIQSRNPNLLRWG